MAKNDLPFPDAVSLFSQRLVCDDFSDWIDGVPLGQVSEISHGLLRANGVSAGAYVHLKCIANRGKKIPDRFKLSIFKYELGQARRAYQLDITRWPRLPASVHDHPHEHIGDGPKVHGDLSWCSWSFDDMMARFCQTTGVSFKPKHPTDPTLFTLRP